MSETARIHSVDAIKAFKASLLKFAETANVALASAEGDLRRTMVWLDSEQLMHWQAEIRKRQEALVRAKDAVRQKLLYPDSTGRPPTPVEEWKQQKIAQRRLEEAEQKLINTRRAIVMLEKEMQTYKGSVQRFSTMVQTDIPRAVERLDRAFGHLETYITMVAPSMRSEAPVGVGEGSSAGSDEAASMARPEDEEQERNAEERKLAPSPDSSANADSSADLDSLPDLPPSPFGRGSG